uniref:Uncharacterized protein n=1 Tax=Proboscia inermis TaxID=420281 RepID=A0A7S0CAF0_9STRA|mmetsp:Transcript_36254/g.36502  ORF Transcript_36254/g.36502 Transcript_36254/m.36502 type:complete len:104 (+) Transcript_36254:131-442(+)
MPSLSTARISKINKFCTHNAKIPRILCHVLIEPRLKTERKSYIDPNVQLPNLLVRSKIFKSRQASKARKLVEHMLCAPLNGRKSNLGAKGGGSSVGKRSVSHR